MHEIEKLKKMLCRELEEYGDKGTLSKSELEYVSTLAEIVKDLGKIVEMDEEYSGASYARRGRGGSRGGSYEGGSYEYDGSYEGSYARNGRGRGSQANRDRMGRYSSERGYSRDDELMSEIEMLPEHKKEKVLRMIKDM